MSSASSIVRVPAVDYQHLWLWKSREYPALEQGILHRFNHFDPNCQYGGPAFLQSSNFTHNDLKEGLVLAFHEYNSTQNLFWTALMIAHQGYRDRIDMNGTMQELERRCKAGNGLWNPLGTL